MLIAVDGACKRNGSPDCIAAGVAWIQTNDGNMYYKSHIDNNSTSQRGEIFGLLLALKEASTTQLEDGEDVIIITDSEYLYNTVMLEWCFKWRDANWKNGSGEDAKNADLWKVACLLLERIGKEKVYMQWTKGHLMSYTPGNAKKAIQADIMGIQLYDQVMTMASIPANTVCIVDKFNRERRDHDKDVLPMEVAREWVVNNTVADLLAYYIVNLYNAEVGSNQQ